MNNYANYLYIAIRAALDAGKAIMDIYTDPESDFGYICILTQLKE